MRREFTRGGSAVSSWQNVWSVCKLHTNCIPGCPSPGRLGPGDGGKWNWDQFSQVLPDRGPSPMPGHMVIAGGMMYTVHETPLTPNPFEEPRIIMLVIVSCCRMTISRWVSWTSSLSSMGSRLTSHMPRSRRNSRSCGSIYEEKLRRNLRYVSQDHSFKSFF